MHSEYNWDDWDDLTTRSANIVAKLGGEEELLNYYKKYGNFMNVNYIGKKSNDELISYCNYLIDKSDKGKDKVIQIEGISSLNQLFVAYEKRKHTLSVRAINVLKYLESSYSFDQNEEQKKAYLDMYIIQKYNFKRLRKIGSKTEAELNVFSSELRSIFKDNILQNNVTPEVVKPTLVSTINSLLEEVLPLSEIFNLIKNDEYNFKELLCIYLCTSKKYKNTNSIIETIYFNDKEFNLKEISKKVELSRERVRQLHLKFSTILIPTAIQKVKEDINFENYDMPIEDGKLFFEFEPICPFESYNKTYTPNSSFSKLFYKNYYSDNYELLEDLVNELIDEQRVFDFSKTIFLVSIELIGNSAFDKLLPFLEENIFEFESHAFDYNLEILIRRFYKENEIEIDQKYIIEIKRIIEKVRCLDIEINTSTIKRIERQKFKNLVIERITDLLNTTQKALRTDELLLECEGNDLDIDRQKLLNLLGKNQNTFVRLGNGLWGLAIWEDSKEFQGSIREIVERTLTKSGVPLHISELIEMISQRRTIDEHSLLSNLKATEQNKFYFFNCSFIGLTSIKYDQYWYNLPRFTATYLGVTNTKRLVKTSNKSIIEYLHKKKGYPMIHLKYISEQRLKNQENENHEFDFE